MRNRDFSGRRLQDIVEEQGRRWDWLARATGLHRTLLWQYRVGVVGITRRSAERIATALGVPVDALRPDYKPSMTVPVNDEATEAISAG